MRRTFKMIITVFILVGCSAPVTPSTPSAQPNPVKVTLDLPTKSVPVVNQVTATDEPAFTPIPDTFTPIATNTITPTQTSTLAATVAPIKATVTRVVTKAPTRTLRPTDIPTVFLPPTNTPAPIAVQPTNPPAQACCKVCTTGKACGDSCIARDKTCRKGPGCACNG